jgi:hypothetical protein
MSLSSQSAGSFVVGSGMCSRSCLLVLGKSTCFVRSDVGVDRSQRQKELKLPKESMRRQSRSKWSVDNEHRFGIDVLLVAVRELGWSRNLDVLASGASNTPCLTPVGARGGGRGASGAEGREGAGCDVRQGDLIFTVRRKVAAVQIFGHGCASSFVEDTVAPGSRVLIARGEEAG